MGRVEVFTSLEAKTMRKGRERAGRGMEKNLQERRKEIRHELAEP